MCWKCGGWRVYEGVASLLLLFVVLLRFGIILVLVKRGYCGALHIPLALVHRCSRYEVGQSSVQPVGALFWLPLLSL